MIRRLSASILRIFVATSVVLVVYVTLFEHRFIYYPERELGATPASAYEDIHFEADDGTLLHGWLIGADSDQILIVSHGNAGNIGHRAEMGDFLKEEFEVHILMYDYRGFGQNDGSPSEEGTYSDIRGAYTFALSKGYRGRQIYLLGQSLGTAVAIDLEAQETVGGVILEAPFTSVGAMVRNRFHLPIDWLLRTRYDSLSKIHGIDAPIAIVHGKDDPVVPFELGAELFEAAGEPKLFFSVDGRIHEGVTMGLGVERVGELRRFIFGAE